MSKTKRLLSVTLAIAMIILSAFSAFADGTETVVETVGAMIVAADSIETDDTTFDVNVKISFNKYVTGPHNIITLTCDKFNLTNVELGDVVYNYTSLEEVNGETVQLPQGKVTIAEDDVKNVNWATGKVLIEAPVDGTAPLVSKINLTATFTLKDDVDLVAGEALNIAVANDDMADASETKLSISSGASVVTVHGAGTTYCYDETNHWLVCAVEGCTEHKYNKTTHTMSDYVASEDGTTETATCSANCGYNHTKDVEVVEPEVTYINWQDITYDFSTDTVHVPFTITSDFYTVLKDASAAGNRQRNLVVTIGSKEYDFGDQKIYDGSNDTTVGGFNITKLNTEVTVKFNVTWTGGEMTTNIYTFVIADELEQQYEKSLLSSTEYMDLDLLGKFVDYNNAYKAALEVSGSEAISYEASDFVTENEAYLDFSTGYVDLETNTFAISFTITDDFYTVLKNASAAGNRQRNLYIEVDGKTYALGDQKITDATNNTTLSGFSAAKLDGTFKVYYNITWTGGEMTTNAITVDIPTVLANGSSDLAVAYSAFNDAKLAFNA